MRSLSALCLPAKLLRRRTARSFAGWLRSAQPPFGPGPRPATAREWLEASAEPGWLTVSAFGLDEPALMTQGSEPATRRPVTAPAPPRCAYGNDHPRPGPDLAPTPVLRKAVDAGPVEAGPVDAGPVGAGPVEPASHPVCVAAVTLAIGVGAGIAGMLLAMLLHVVQHIAYGYSLHAVIGHESFLSGVTGAAPARRVAVLAVCGLVAGLGWWAVYGVGRPLVSIRQALNSDCGSMPVATIGHALLQIVTVGLGSPLGREVAPREVGALLATWMARLGRLNRADTRIMIACGAGAGLAAVYNVPLSGAIFTLEVLLQTFGLPAALPAVATSVIAALVAWAGLGDEAQYRLPQLSITASLVCWSMLLGPAFGYAGTWYARLATAARARAPRDWRLMPFCLAAFAAIGVASIRYPQLLGNGKGPMQLGLDGDIGLGLALTLLALKLAATTASLRAGAEGGMLTPGMAAGALLATALGLGWNAAWPGTAPGAFAIVGGAAFLSSSMAMPLTAICLVMEFTRMDHDFLVPVMLAVAGAMAARHRMQR